MQQRLVDLLDKIGNEEVTSEWKFVDMVDQISDQWDFRWMVGGLIRYQIIRLVDIQINIKMRKFWFLSKWITR